MKGIKHECQLMDRCDGHDHGGGVRKCGKVRQFSGRCRRFVRCLFQRVVVRVMNSGLSDSHPSMQGSPTYALILFFLSS